MQLELGILNFNEKESLMRKVIVLSALLLITGMSVYAQEDYSKSLKTTTTIVENADKYKVETNRFWSNWFVTAGGGGLIFSVTIICR